MEEHELKAKQLGFESYEEAVRYNDMAGCALGIGSLTKEQCINNIEIEHGKGFLEKPRNEQLYELLHRDINILDEYGEYRFDDKEVQESFKYLEYHILELKKYHLNLQMEQQKRHGSR